jgi:hypothetical protein
MLLLALIYLVLSDFKIVLKFNAQQVQDNAGMVNVLIKLKLAQQDHLALMSME